MKDQFHNALKQLTKWLTQKRIFLLTFIFSLFILGISIYSVSLQDKWLKHDLGSQLEKASQKNKFEILFRNIQTAESAVRGYAGTENKNFVTNFNSYITAVGLNYNGLKDYLYRQNKNLNSNMFLDFDRLVQQKIEFLQKVKGLCDKGDFSTALNLIATERGAILTDAIFKINESMQINLHKAQLDAERNLRKRNIIITWLAYAGLIISVLFIVIIFYMLFKETRLPDKISDELELQKDFMNVTLSSIGDGLITTNNNGKIIYMNPAAEKLTGWVNKDVIDKPLQTVYDIRNEETGMPIDNIVSRIIRERKSVAYENNTVLRTKNAGKIVISNSGSPLLDSDGTMLGAVLVFNDITERKRDEEKIKSANERYEILAKATSDTIWDWDIRKDTIGYNSGITNTFGYNVQEVKLIAGWWKNNLHPEDVNHVTTLLDKVFNEKEQTIQIEYRYRCADNTYRNILDRAFIVYDEAGLPIRVIGAMQDVTKEKEHERQTAIAIIEAQEKERKELAMELHDNVNQLLGATLLYLGMAKKSGKLGNEISEALNNCVDYVSEAITDIRNLSHRLTPHNNGDISFKEVIEYLIEPMQKTKQFEINLQVDDFNNAVLERDIQNNLYRIIQEQLNNILKHAQATKVYINVLLTNENIKLSIKDNGKGFNTSAAKEGIGLQNIRQRAELFSGIFTINSSPGNGCELKVEIPLK